MAVSSNGFLPPHQLLTVSPINGIYWGMQILHERPDEDFQVSYQGGVAEEYNVFKHFEAGVLNESNDNFKELNSILDTKRDDPALTDEQYAAALELLDVDDLVDYMLVNYYGGNRDWDHHNYYASQNPIDGKWHFHS